MNDTEWITMLQTDADRAMTGFKAQYMALVAGIVRNRVGGVCSESEISDCINDVFSEFALSASKIDPQKGTVKGWLCAITKHKSTDLFRKASMEKGTLSLDDEESIEFSSGESAEDEQIRNARNEALTDAILSLGEPDREIIVRRFYYLESSASVAERLHLTAGAVDTRVSRALKKLRKRLEKEKWI